MKTSSPVPRPAYPLLIAILAGCFGGEDGESPVDPEDFGGPVQELSPGLYAGDYGPFDSSQSLESETTLGEDGGFRHYWIERNEPIGEQRGSWIQKGSRLHLTGMTEGFVDFEVGTMLSVDPVEDDTDRVREVTDSSFLRLEWLPWLQESHWVAYRKASVAPIRPGNYQFEWLYRKDSATTIPVRIRLELDSASFLYRYLKDTAETDQIKAEWSQQGSVFRMEGLESRGLDSATHEFTPWEPIAGSLFQRVSMVTDTSFEMWTPGTQTWELYRKVP